MHPTTRTVSHPVLSGRRITCSLATSVLSLALAACVPGNARQDDSLYQALGGPTGVDQLVEKLLDRCYADERIAFLFKNADRRDLHRLISEQFCAESGGPCTYTGRSMTEAHSGLQIGHAEFEAFVEDFTDAMEDVKLPYRTQNRMLKVFAPMQPEVVDQ